MDGRPIRGVATSRNDQDPRCGGGWVVGNTEVAGEIGRMEKRDQASISGCSAGPTRCLTNDRCPVGSNVCTTNEHRRQLGSLGKQHAGRQRQLQKVLPPCSLSVTRMCPKTHGLS